MKPAVSCSVFVCLLCVSLGIVAAPLPAAVFQVTSTADTQGGPCLVGACSLRQAVTASNVNADPDTILVPAGLYPLQAGDGDQGGDLDVTDGVTFLGSGSARTIVHAGSVDRVFDLHTGSGMTTLVGLTITGGATSDGGGGVRATAEASLVLDHCTVAYNHAAAGGGIYAVGEGSILLLHTNVSGNTAIVHVGVPPVDVDPVALHVGGGGVYASDRLVTLSHATLSANLAPFIAGLAVGGDGSDDARVTLDASTFSDNGDEVSGDNQAGVAIASVPDVLITGSTFAGTRGGAGLELFIEKSSATIVDSTVLTGSGMGLRITQGSSLRMSSSTVATGQASAIALYAENSNPQAVQLDLEGSVIAGRCVLAAAATVASRGGSVESPGNTCRLDPALDHTSVSAGALHLGPLGDYGGPTSTMALLRPSVAIGAAVDCPALDQRGAPRPADDGDGGRCDAGAYEVQTGAADEPCARNAVTACIDDAPGDRRFEIRVHWRTATLEGAGRVSRLDPLGIDRGALFYFFDADNPELLVKVLDACAVYGKHWVFYSAGTNQEFTLTVRDSHTGATKIYSNPLGNAAPPVQDVAAFACGSALTASARVAPGGADIDIAFPSGGDR